MNSKMCKGESSDFCFYVSMALKDRLPWRALAIIFNDAAPTLNETREIINILLRELETLHLALRGKQTELGEYQVERQTFANSKSNDRDHLAENEIIADDDRVMEPYPDDSDELDDSLSKIKAKVVEEEDIEVLEVVKETINEEMCFEMNGGTKIPDLREPDNFLNESDPPNNSVDESIREIDNEWYTFVSNDKNSDSSVIQMPEEKEESEQLFTKEAKVKPFHCKFCTKSFQKSGILKKHEFTILIIR